MKGEDGACACVGCGCGCLSVGAAGVRMDGVARARRGGEVQRMGGTSTGTGTKA